MEPFARLPKRVLQDDQLPARARLLFAALDKELDKRTGQCSPSLERLAGLVGCDRRTVRRLVKLLEGAGYVRVDRASGRQNAYVLLPATGDTSVPGGGDTGVPGLAHVPGDTGVPGGGDTGVPGLARVPYMTLKEQEKERATPPPARAKPFRAADTQLFADQHRRDFASEVAYRLGDVPELAPWRAWYPALVAEFWLARGFVVRVNDPQTVVDVWGRELAKIGATEAEVAAAFEWARVDAVNHRGDAVYSRPDLLREVRRRILAKRPRLTNQAVHRAPVDRPHESTAAELAAWDRAGEAEREAVRERVGRRVRYRGPMFERDCARELARELARRAAAAPSTGVT